MRSDLLAYMINSMLSCQAALAGQHIEETQRISTVDISNGIFSLNSQCCFKTEVSAHDGDCFT
ncbi:hypothetical protein TR67_15585 [Pseudomonas deceptionensis]|nr:hypothetical protein TR67_15585 [Pseudomonas deceptionensis]